MHKYNNEELKALAESLNNVYRSVQYTIKDTLELERHVVRTTESPIYFIFQISITV